MGRVAALRHHNWKLVIFQPRDAAARRIELYDLDRDPGEKSDLAKERPDELRKLFTIWQRFDREMVPPLWTPGG
jgi:arylsulfatase A-like enzyme